MTTRTRVLKLSHLPAKQIAAELGISLSGAYRHINNGRDRCVIVGEVNGKVVCTDVINYCELKMKTIQYRAYLKAYSFGLPWTIYVSKQAYHRPVSWREQRKLNDAFARKFAS